MVFYKRGGATPPPHGHGQRESLLHGHVSPLPSGQPCEAGFDWASGDLPDQEQIAAMTYEELLKYADGGGVEIDNG